MATSNLRNILARAKNFLLRLVLRGNVGDYWLRRKTGKLVALYHRLLLRDRRSASALPSPRAVARGEPLRRLLFICDSMWEQRELLPELSRICEVSFVDVHPHIHRPVGSPLWESLRVAEVLTALERLKGQAFDCVIVYLRSPLLSQELLDFLRRTWRCPLVGMNLDCKTTFDDYQVFRGDPTGYSPWARAFDSNLTNARAMLDVYAANNSPALYLPTGYHYDPEIHRLRTDAKFELELSFVGSCKPERRALVERLRRHGIAVSVFGGGWGDQPFAKEGWKVYQRSQLNLGIGYNVPAERITNLKNRDFECPGSGACYLTTFDWELARLFEVGREILCYRSLDELIEVHSFYVRRPEACLRIASAGFQRCVRDHTWEKRFRKVFQELGFNAVAADVSPR